MVKVEYIKNLVCMTRIRYKNYLLLVGLKLKLVQYKSCMSIKPIISL